MRRRKPGAAATPTNTATMAAALIEKLQPSLDACTRFCAAAWVRPSHKNEDVIHAVAKFRFVVVLFRFPER